MKVYRHKKSAEKRYPSDEELFGECKPKEIMCRTDVSHETFLMKLVESNQPEALQKFLIALEEMPSAERKRLLNAVDKRHRSALQIACTMDKVMVTALLEKGADPNLAGREGMLPLSLAIAGGNIQTVKTLLDHGANVDIESKDSLSPFKQICIREETENTTPIFNCLLKHTILNKPTDTTPPLFLCILAKNHFYIEQLLNRGANANTIVFGADHTTTNSASNLLEQFSSIFGGHSALTYAIFMNDLNSVILLLRYGAKIGKTNLPTYYVDKKIELFLEFPFMAKEKTKAGQISLLFYDYANPPMVISIFPTTNRHYHGYAKEIRDNLRDKDLDDAAIRNIMNDVISKIPGGYAGLRNGEFKRRIDRVFNDFLNPAPLNNHSQSVVTRPKLT